MTMHKGRNVKRLLDNCIQRLKILMKHKDSIVVEDVLDAEYEIIEAV